MYLKKNLTAAILMVALVLFCSPVLAEQHRPTMSVLRPIIIETAQVLAEGRVAFNAGGAVELDREVSGGGGLEYDNLRLTPFGVRYGLGSGFEAGVALAFSSNDANDAGAPDNSGLEGLSLFGKLQLNKFSALRVGLTLGGDDDVYPYPNDGIDFFANLALQKPVEYGLVYGEFGYKAQGGDLDFNSYFNYGVGFAMSVADAVGVNVELVGEQVQEIQVANTLDLVLGATLLLTDGLRLAPYVSLGLMDASPDLASGAMVELRF